MLILTRGQEDVNNNGANGLAVHTVVQSSQRTEIVSASTECFGRSTPCSPGRSASPVDRLLVELSNLKVQPNILDDSEDLTVMAHYEGWRG